MSKIKEMPTADVRVVGGGNPSAKDAVIARNKVAGYGSRVILLNTTGATEEFLTQQFCGGCRNFTPQQENIGDFTTGTCAILQPQDHIDRVRGGVCQSYTIAMGRKFATVREYIYRPGRGNVMTIYRFDNSERISEWLAIRNRFLQRNGQG